METKEILCIIAVMSEFLGKVSLISFYIYMYKSMSIPNNKTTATSKNLKPIFYVQKYADYENIPLVDV